MRNPGGLLNRWLVGATARVWAKRTSGSPDAGEKRRVLLVRVDERVGNLLCMQPIIDVLNDVLPGGEIGLLASGRMEQVAASLDGVRHLHLIDKRWVFSRPLKWRGVVRKIRSIAYDTAVDASSWHEFSYTHAALTYFSGAPVRIGFERSGAPGGVLHSEQVRPGPAGEYEVAQRLRLLRPLGVKVEQPPPLRTSLGAGKAVKWREWLSERLGASRWVGLWPGGRKRRNRWNTSGFVEVARRLLRRVHAVVCLWGGRDELELAKSLSNAAGKGCIVAPPTGVADLAGILRNLALFVSNDTGPMHLAVAVKTPTVAVFTRDEATRWGHPVPWARNLHCPGERIEDEVEKIWGACLELLSPGDGGNS
ncbi:MAG: lipopolysaccharide heptosyltransferase family protein [Deltaproteobacteria bacterium]|nr:MAG: lipopolysaccharide heptosyltransferase family protein [Deltaproteobacteria bacterium]